MDGSGKTSILKHFSTDECPVLSDATPSEGYNIVSFTNEEHRSVLKLYDIGGSKETRGLWSTYYDNTSAVIFVMDCADRRRLNEVGVYFTLLINESRLNKVPILIYANKQDLLSAISEKDVRDAFNLYGNLGHPLHLESTSALTGVNIKKGIEWLLEQLRPLKVLKQK